jgi:DNA-binding NtrC family response regulator
MLVRTAVSILQTAQWEMEDPEHLRHPRPDQTIILVVDDDVMIRNVARTTLEADGYFVLAAHDGEEALHLARKFPGTIHAVLSDVNMPKIDGLELRERILEQRPGVPVLLMSGHGNARFPTYLPFLAKPFDPAILKEQIRQLLASSP